MTAAGARQALEDFMHYTAIAMPDLADASVQALLNAGMGNGALAGVVDQSPAFESKLNLFMWHASRSYPQLRGTVAELRSRIDAGRTEVRQ